MPCLVMYMNSYKCVSPASIHEQSKQSVKHQVHEANGFTGKNSVKLKVSTTYLDIDPHSDKSCSLMKALI